MHTGLFLEFPALDDVTDQQAFQHGFQMAEEAERLGVESVWLAEYHFIPFSVLSSPVMVATAIAGRTERIRIGLGVLLLPLGNAIRIAEEIATLDHISQGRLDFGVGRGTFPEHHDAFLSPYPESRGRFDEYLEIILKAWTTDQFSFEVEHYPCYDLAVRPKPYQKPHPPIGVAGVSVKSGTLVRAGEEGWIPMSINIVPTRILKSHWEAVLEGAATTGRTPDRSQWRVARNVFVADTTQEARRCVLEGTMARDFEDYFLRLLPKCKMLDLMKTDLDMPDSDVTPEYLLDNLWLVGSPDDVAEKLQALQDDPDEVRRIRGVVARITYLTWERPR